MKIKFNLYDRAGVKEYWLVDPAHKTVQVYRIGEDGLYGGRTFIHPATG